MHLARLIGKFAMIIRVGVDMKSFNNAGDGINANYHSCAPNIILSDIDN